MFFSSMEYSGGESWCPAARSAQPAALSRGCAQGLAKPLTTSETVFEGDKNWRPFFFKTESVQAKSQSAALSQSGHRQWKMQRSFLCVVILFGFHASSKVTLLWSTASDRSNT